MEGIKSERNISELKEISQTGNINKSTSCDLQKTYSNSAMASVNDLGKIFIKPRSTLILRYLL